MNLLTDLLASYNPESPNFRPTEIYNESWLVKIVLHLASTIQDQDHALSFLLGSSWFSEALLPTAFKSRYRKDSLGESRTNADGVIGHFRIGHQAKADFELLETAKQFTVVEAKVGSPLSKGIINDPEFDQAARNVACMAETLAQADLKPMKLDRLEFIVLAPEKSIEKGIFAEKMTKSSLQYKTKQRVDAYKENDEKHYLELNTWYEEYFLQTMQKIRLVSLSWESVIGWLSDHKPAIEDPLAAYYELCKRFN
ncbi:MAG: hypothetical protein MUP11_06080 [Anaerolineales bacterium]|nr:hypothetical protein [Anaerolineales bacterium]